MAERRNSYTSAFKLRLIKSAEGSDNSKVARKYNIDVSMVRRWRLAKDKLGSSTKTRRSFRGKQCQLPHLEKELKEWIEDSRLKGFIITRPMIRIQALKLAKSQKHQEIDGIKNFVASPHWCDRFMKREDLVLRCRTKIAQKLPAELEEKVTSFQRYTINLRKLYGYGLEAIGNMDETPLTFDLPANRTVDTRGTKTVMVKTSGHEKLHFTCVLSVTADGGKLPPLVVFKRKKIHLR